MKTLDFRSKLYANYVSKFKGKSSPVHSDSIFKWYDFKYLHLFNGLNEDAKILDIGCGQGHMLQYLVNKGYKDIVGIDISVEQVEVAVSHGLEAVVADVFDYLGSKDGYYDAILAIDVIEHLSKDELVRLIPQIYQSLKPGGRFIIQTPNAEGFFTNQIIYGDLTHMTIFTPNSLEQVLNYSGFNNISFYETGPVPKNLINVFRVLAWWCIKVVLNFIRMVEVGKLQSLWTENMICYSNKP